MSMKINNIEEERKKDIRYWNEEIFKINGKIDIAKTLTKKRKLQNKFIKKTTKVFNNKAKKFGFHLNIPVIHINKNEKFVLDYFI